MSSSHASDFSSDESDSTTDDQVYDMYSGYRNPYSVHDDPNHLPQPHSYLVDRAHYNHTTTFTLGGGSHDVRLTSSDGVVFHVSGDVLVGKTNYFARAIAAGSQSFAESRTRAFELALDEASLRALLVFLYHGKVVGSTPGHFHAIAQLYVSADSYDTHDDCRRVLSSFLLSASRILELEEVQELFDAVGYLCDNIVSHSDVLWDAVCAIEWEFVNLRGNERAWSAFVQQVSGHNKKLERRFAEVALQRTMAPARPTPQHTQGCNCLVECPPGLGPFIPSSAADPAKASSYKLQLACVHCGEVRRYRLWREETSGIQHIWISGNTGARIPTVELDEYGNELE